jgi:hypothetical protein
MTRSGCALAATAALLFLLLLSPAAATDDKKVRIAQEMAAGSKCDMRSDKGLKEYVQHLTNVVDMEPDADMYFSVLQKRASALQVPTPSPLTAPWPTPPLPQALKRYSAARSDWEAILLLKPDDAKALEKQAQLLVQEGRLDAAVTSYRPCHTFATIFFVSDHHPQLREVAAQWARWQQGR